MTDKKEEWSEGSMTFQVGIKNAQEDFFVREISAALCERMTNRMEESIEERANALIEEKITAKLDEVISEVIQKGLSTELQPSDAFSNPKGEPVTALEFIAQGAESFLKQTVDRDGKPSNAHFSGKKLTRLEHYLQSTITRQFEDELNKEVKTMKASILAQMKAAAASWLAKFQAETATGIEQAKALGSTIR